MTGSLGVITYDTMRSVERLLDGPHLGRDAGLDNAAHRGWVVKTGRGSSASYDLTPTARLELARRRFAGGVYFIEGSGLIKIGVSGNVAKRFAELQCANAAPLTLLGHIPRADSCFEQWLHARYASYRRHGEWFEPSAELLALAKGELPEIIRTYNAQEAAERLGINRKLVYEAADQELLQCALRNGRGVRFVAFDVDAIATALAQRLAESAVDRAEHALRRAFEDAQLAVRSLRPKQAEGGTMRQSP